jgi:hypothetical protein
MRTNDESADHLRATARYRAALIAIAVTPDAALGHRSAAESMREDARRALGADFNVKPIR